MKIEMIRNLEEKPADKFTSNTIPEALAKSWKITQNRDIESNRAEFNDHFREYVNPLP
jgi:hypothetical protein